jgi:hypothetical protein
MGREAWKEHVDEYHNAGVRESQFDQSIQSIQPPPTADSHYACPICTNCFKSRRSMGKHMAKEHEEFFEKPFKYR